MCIEHIRQAIALYAHVRARTYTYVFRSSIRARLLREENVVLANRSYRLARFLRNVHTTTALEENNERKRKETRRKGQV